MDDRQKEILMQVRKQMTDFLVRSVTFWLEKSVDPNYAGYLVCFDENGNPATHSEVLQPTDKMIVTQSRMVWGLSALISSGIGQRFGIDMEKCNRALDKGVALLYSHIWDREFGGFAWYTNQMGEIQDNGKLVYGQSFGIYALSQFAIAREPAILSTVKSAMEKLTSYCADTVRGGYYENLKADWTVEKDRDFGGDLKSLDIHMHIMEALTVYYQAQPTENTKRLLLEVIEIILTHMIDYDYGCGRNQFDNAFRPKPAWAIHRTWNYDRDPEHANDNPLDTTSFGHNIELSWLLNRAYEVLGLPPAVAVTRKLVDYSLDVGWDPVYGGFYRDGLHDGRVTNTDKEWWQNFEALTGLFDAYQVTQDDKYLEKFFKLWEFDYKYFYNPDVGESRRLLKANGEVIDGSIGNQWKCMYHTDRAMIECLLRFDQYI